MVAIGCWLLLAVSMGWYYTITYFGRVGWPMPSVETAGALLFYYFSVLNVDTEIQTVHWLIAYPLAGAVWVVLIQVVHRNAPDRPRPSLVAAAFSLCTLPLSLPAPYLAWLAGQRDSAWHWQRMIEVALRRGNLAPWPWLSPGCILLALAAFFLHLSLYRRLYPATLITATKHYLITAIGFVLAVSSFGLLLSFPLRAWLE
ncbi:MAG: hypothetical protein HYV26_15240 [Candidatus Hydrogenedentes bacterium]|nr:hypothetical protein [Candidatus Hydrogenedentota bacterium]